MAMLLFRKKKEIVKRLFNQNRAAAAAYSFMWKKKIRVPERLYWKRAALNRIEKLYKPEKGESKKVIRYSFFAFTSNDRGARKWLARREKKKRKAMRGLFKIKMAYEGRGINYLKKRDARQWNEGVLKGAEGKPFWTVDWWKKPTIKTFQEWNYEKWGFVKEPYKVYVEKNGGFKKTPVKWEKIIPNVGGRFIKYFLKRFFKVFFKKIMKKIKTAGPRVLNNTTYGKLKESVTFYFYLLKGLIVKSNFRPASYFLSNVTFKKIWNPNFVPDYYSRSFLETSSLPRGMPNPVGAFSVAGVKDFSNYIAYNKFVLLKFLLYMLGFTKSVFNLNFNNIKFFTPIAGFAKKKYRDMVKKKKKRKGDLKKTYWTLLAFAYYKWLPLLKQYEWAELKKRVVFAGPQLMKKPHMKRGGFYFLKKRAPKFYKSNKNLRLFSKFVRPYSIKKRSVLKRMLRHSAGFANVHFKIVGCRKYFKQKIFIRAKFMAHYKGVNQKKMYCRWRRIKKSRSKWIGFYKNFEGQSVRALKWSGLSYKYSLSKFLIKNGMCFLNGRVIENEREVVAGNDILSIRSDVFQYLEKRRLLTIFRRCVSRYPLFNKNAKSALTKKVLKLYKKDKKGYLKGGLTAGMKKIFKKAVLKKKIGADGVYLKEAKNQPYITLDQKKIFHKKVKSKNALLFRHYLNRKKWYQHFSTNYDDLDVLNGNDNFFQRLGPAVAMYNYPVSVNRFFAGADLRFTKMMNPRTLRNFYERNYLY